MEGKKVTVVELLKDGDRVRGFGGSKEVSEKESEKLLKAGTHKIKGAPLRGLVAEAEEKKDDGIQ